ncbi:MAG: hypothetical protein ACLVJ6_08805 [Merdibacter sp.]
MRQEIEGIAQQIIARDLDADDIALCALDPFYESLAAESSGVITFHIRCSHAVRNQS